MKKLLALACVLFPAGGWAASADLGSQVVAGKQLFETTCAASTCHGSGGVGATGPKLVDRNFSLDQVRGVLLNGRPGTAMPAFKDLFDADMLASVTAYVLSISTGGRWATAVPVQQEDKAAASKPFPASVKIGKDSGVPAAGYALFYDATRATACRTCHRHRENGGPVGPDFVDLGRPAPKIFETLSKPVAGNAVVVTTRSGARYSGVKKTDDGAMLRIVDVSSLPPVTRSFRKADVASETPGAPFDHATLSYTAQELRDAAAFLSIGK